ncbi:hypothetical protein [Shewanella sp. T24-MNA-CIBAN-0130]|uniref:hypothetical protein n=1 Tax=Shewanella sp. T24-MNA-CIBAN-0130 TaxID=3140470 RepID=UPI0033289B92
MNEFKEGGSLYFIACGIKFVEGDVIGGMPLSAGREVDSANKGVYMGHCVSYFAPRIITETKPVPSDVMVNVSSDGVKWSNDVAAKYVLLSADNKFWRPALKQKCIAKSGPTAGQSEPTTYTQEMFDSGASVKVGMMFATECGKYKAEMVNLKSICFADENDFLCVIPVGLAKPIVTEREKAIDAAYDHVYGGRLAPINHDAIKQVLGDLYDADCSFGGEL